MIRFVCVGIGTGDWPLLATGCDADIIGPGLSLSQVAAKYYASPGSVQPSPAAAASFHRSLDYNHHS